MLERTIRGQGGVAMIKDNEVFFGKGKIAVGIANNPGYLDFSEIAEAQKIGSDVLPETELTNKAIMPMDAQNLYDFAEFLRDIDKSAIIQVGDLKLNFSHFDKRSIDVLRKQCYIAFGRLWERKKERDKYV